MRIKVNGIWYSSDEGPMIIEVAPEGELKHQRVLETGETQILVFPKTWGYDAILAWRKALDSSVQYRPESPKARTT